MADNAAGMGWFPAAVRFGKVGKVASHVELAEARSGPWFDRGCHHAGRGLRDDIQ